MTGWSSDMKKVSFFTEQKYKDTLNIQTIDDIKNNKINKEINTININNISISGPREIHAINDLLFINGKLIHEKDGKMIRENLIMKILDNKIIDLYRVFNGVYFNFELKIFRNKPLFVVIGGNFNEYLIDCKKELFMVTSIKIYDATQLINNKTGQYPPANLSNSKEEPYPKLLLKNIKLMKRLFDNKIMCEVNELEMQGYESFQDINSFAINSELTHAAVSLDKGDIILIYGYPNLIECDYSKLKMIYLPKIIFTDKGHITNLFFTVIKNPSNFKRVLYASTPRIIYYFEWNNDSNLEKDIQLHILNEGGPGGYRGCIDVKDKYLLMGSSRDDYICEFENLEISKTWLFDGKKTNVYYFKDYILFAVSSENNSSLQVYNKKVSIFAYYKNSKKKIIGLCYDNNNIYVVYEKSPNYKYILKLTEKELNEKIKILINKKFFDIAISYAEIYNLPQITIISFIKEYAEYEYNKGNFNSSIQQYIKTIGNYDPSNIVLKFNSQSKIGYLIIYLQKYLEQSESKYKLNEEYKIYTELLLNCYISQNNIQKFKEYIKKKENYFSKELSKNIINLILQIKDIDLALKLAKQKKLYVNYIEILFKFGRKEEALKYIKSLNKEEKVEQKEDSNIPKDQMMNHYEEGKMNSVKKNYSIRVCNVVPIKKMINIFNRVTIYFLSEDKNNENKLADEYFETFLHFLYKNQKNIEEKDMNYLVYNFLYHDKYFIPLFEKLVTYQIAFDEKILHRRIELYLEEINKNQNEKEQEIVKEKIVKLLSNPKYQNIYNFRYLMILFKNNNFIEGIELISEQKNSFDDLLLILFNDKKYKKVLNIFDKYTPKEKTLWEKALQLFFQNVKNSNNNEEENNLLKQCISEYLLKLYEKKVISSIDILDIIEENNNDIPLDLIKDFYLKVVDQENKTLVDNIVKSKEYESTIAETEEEIKSLIEKPINLKLLKCDECLMGIEFPCIFFKCGHYFHSLCISYYSKDLRNAHCPKCYITRRKIENRNLETQKLFNNLNSEEGLKNELSKQSNQIEFLNTLFSKGIFQSYNSIKNLSDKKYLI